MSNSDRKISPSTTSLIEKKIQTESGMSVVSFLKDIADPDGTIDLSKLKKIGGGSTHDIFRSEKHPELVLKVMRPTAGKDKDDLAIPLQMHDDQSEVLYETFGPSRCMIERRSIQSIKNLTPNDTAQTAVISVVPFDSCFDSKEKFGFNVVPIEFDDPLLIESKRYLYQRVNKSFLGKEKPSLYVMKNYPLLNKNFEKIFKLLETDASLATAMREFLTKYKMFYKRSGLLLDTVGLDNVLFYKTADGWQFKLGSVIKHDSGALTKKTLGEIKSNPSIVLKSPLYSTSVYLMPACIRALNACAEKVGMDKVIDDIFIDDNTINILAKMHEQLGKGYRAINYTERGKFAEALELFHQYVSEEKEHDTRVRAMMGTHYWDYIKKGGKPNSPEEVETYLGLLRDPKNNFPDFRKKAVEEAIKGLSDKQKFVEEKVEHKAEPSKTSSAIDPHQKRERESDKEYVSRLGRIKK